MSFEKLANFMLSKNVSSDMFLFLLSFTYAFLGMACSFISPNIANVSTVFVITFALFHCFPLLAMHCALASKISLDDSIKIKKVVQWICVFFSVVTALLLAIVDLNTI